MCFFFDSFVFSFFFHIFALMKTGITSQRIQWIDMAKGYGMIFVIIGHWNIPYITDYLYAFHIPLFFFLSGVVYSLKKSFALFFKTKIQRIIIPYFCLGITVVFSNLLFSKGFGFGLTDVVKEARLLVVQERYTTLWFFACLLILNILMYPLIRYVRCRWLSDFIVFIICLCGILLWRNGILVLPWNIDAAMVVLPFFYGGYRLKEVLISLGNIQKRHFYIIVIVTFFGILVWLLNTWNMALTGEKVDLFYSNLNIELLTFLAATIGVAMIVLFSMSHINCIIKYIGENSILFFVWHQTIILQVLCRIYWKIGIMQSNYIEINIIKCFSVILTLVIITILNEVIIHSGLKYILGR